IHTFNISTETLNGERINSTVKYQIFSIKESNVYAENFDTQEDAKIGDEVLSGTYQSQQKQLEVSH
ncbi:MAG TPA: hypothetical protein PKJ75_04380, partial [Methanosarcina vacuolata]|nr:hypothetical protein [Methanosarcina vacuolata]